MSTRLKGLQSPAGLALSRLQMVAGWTEGLGEPITDSAVFIHSSSGLLNRTTPKVALRMVR